MLPAYTTANAADNLAVDLSSAVALRTQAAKGDPSSLRAVAKQFEAMMISQMLKTMRDTHFVDEADDPFGSNNMKLYQDLLDQQWAAHLSNGRGLGYADMLSKAFEKYARPAADGASISPPTSSKSLFNPLSAPAAVNPSTALPSLSPPVNHDSSAPVTGQSSRDEQRHKDFLDSHRPQAEAASQATGIPADFILAHAALESGWGTREIKTEAGQPSHNLFGIKSGAGWRGGTVDTSTTEYRQGLALRSKQGFRTYADYNQAFDDYAQLLNNRYSNAAAAGADARGFAQALATGGYATDPAYPQKLQAVIAKVAMLSN